MTTPEPTNILWMAEELDFAVQPDRQAEAEQLLGAFLSATVNPALSHWLYQA